MLFRFFWEPVRTVIMDGSIGLKQIEIILFKLASYSNPKLKLDKEGVK